MTRRLLVLSQVYVPDPASVGQHMHGAAREMVRRGWDVTVLTSASGYEDPTRRYPLRETIDGVQIRRLPLSSFGKSTIPLRLAGATSFLSQALVGAMLAARPDRLLVSTSPPMCSVAALAVHALRGTPITYWVMDVNPDQAVAMGKVSAGSAAKRAFDGLNRRILGRARDVVALDRFMAGRLEAKCPVGERMHIMPPWHHLDFAAPDIAHSANPFRKAHGLEDQFVVMYSGNISPAHPLDTLLEASHELADDKRLRFVFVGGGAGRAAIERFIGERASRNIDLLPYQPMDQLPYSLAAADVHLVSMGDDMVGIVHPCKVYGAMAAGRPVLLLGPQQCHIAELLQAGDFGWQSPHGDVPALVRTLRAMLACPTQELSAMGQRARSAAANYGSDPLCIRLCDVLEAD